MSARLEELGWRVPTPLEDGLKPACMPHLPHTYGRAQACGRLDACGLGTVIDEEICE